MIIGFWSEKPGKGSVTYNLLASGLAISERCKSDVVLIQGKVDYNRLEYAFMPYAEENILKEDYGYYSYGGMDVILNKLENQVYSDRELLNEIVRVHNSNLYYLPTSRSGCQDVFHKRLSKVYDRYIESLHNMKAVVLMEFTNGFEYVTKEMLDGLDLLVINISQDNKALEEIKNYRSLMEKAVFVIGRYDDSSEFNIRNISRHYGIDYHAIGAVPYNIRFKDAVCMGKSKEFYERNKSASKNDDSYAFMKHLSATSDMIIKRCLIE